MSDYRERTNQYKAKLIGQIDAKVVAPKGRKKQVAKPWCVVVAYPRWPTWGPNRNEFQHEHDARSFLRKEGAWDSKIVWLEYNGEKVQ